MEGRHQERGAQCVATIAPQQGCREDAGMGPYVGEACTRRSVSLVCRVSFKLSCQQSLTKKNLLFDQVAWPLRLDIEQCQHDVLSTILLRDSS